MVRNQPAKPELSEEARRYGVQADSFVGEKRYEQTLATAPWLAETPFNRAMVLSDQDRYTEAITSMKNFLALEAALNIAPWWATGHFNRALLLGKADRFAEAVSEMKRYLALERNAKDARAAKDTLYRWEGAASRRRIFGSLSKAARLSFGDQALIPLISGGRRSRSACDTMRNQS